LAAARAKCADAERRFKALELRVLNFEFTPAAPRSAEPGVRRSPAKLASNVFKCEQAQILVCSIY
jgi:hypothetical protein